MRHAAALGGLLLVLGLTGWAVDAVARRSAAPGVLLAWTSTPGALLAALPGGRVRIVGTWWSGHLVQLHVDSMREIGSPPLPAATLRLPKAGVVLAGCG